MSFLYTQKALTDKDGPMVLPFGIIEKDEHTGTFVILKTLIVMAVRVADQVIKDSGVNDVQEAGARVIGGRFLDSITVALVVLPPGGKEHPQHYRVPALYPALSCFERERTQVWGRGRGKERISSRLCAQHGAPRGN